MKLSHLASIFEPPTAKTWRPADRSPVNARARLSSGDNAAHCPNNSHYDYGSTQLHPYLVLPARNVRYKVNTSLPPEELESIQHRSSQWKKSKVAAKGGYRIVSRVWVYIDSEEYMLEEVGGHTLTERFEPDSPTHVAVLSLLHAMSIYKLRSCYVWNMPATEWSSVGRELCMEPRRIKPRPP